MVASLAWRTEDEADTIDAGSVRLTVEPDVDERDRGLEGYLWCVEVRHPEWDQLAAGKAGDREAARRALIAAGPEALRRRADELRREADELNALALSVGRLSA